MLPVVEAVVGREDDGGVVHQSHSLHHSEQVAEPRIHESDLAAVGGVGLPNPALGQAGHVAPVAIGCPHLLTVVIGHVEPSVVGRRVPRLVGVPDVDVEEELLLVVTLQPSHRPDHRLGDIGVRFVAPIGPGVPRLGLVLNGLVADIALKAGLLTRVHEKGLESPVVVHAAADIEGGIDRGGGVDPAPGEQLGERFNVVGEGLPSHERHGPAAGREVGAGRHGGEGGRVVPVESH